MIATLDSTALEIEELVAANELKQAILRLMDFARNFAVQKRQKEREAVSLKGMYREYQKEYRLNGRTQTSVSFANQIRQNILELLDSIIEEWQSKQHNTVAVEISPLSNNETSLHVKLDNHLTQQNIQVKQDEKEFVLGQKKEFEQDSDDVLEYPNRLSSQLQTYPKHNRKTFIREDKLNLVNEQSLASSSEDTVFDGHGITKTYKSRATNFTLYPLNLQLKTNEITAIVGENGNGKTTLLEIVASLLSLTGGQLSYPSLTKKSNDSLFRIKQHIAYIPQELSNWSGRLIDNLYFSAASHGIKGQKNQEEVDFIINRLDLEDYRNANWKEISGGYKMRFALAKALVWEPKLLILDEPLANLDINTQLFFLQDLRNITNSISAPLSVIVSSQHLHMIESVADNIIFLQRGKVLYNGTVANFGKDREGNSFEISCELSKDSLIDLLEEQLSYRSVEIAGNHFIINTTLEVTPPKLLSLFITNNISLAYYRDISCSTRKLFKVLS